MQMFWSKNSSIFLVSLVVISIQSELKPVIEPAKKVPQQLLNLTLPRRRPLSYRNQSIDLLRKSINWFLYDNGLRHERVKERKDFQQVWIIMRELQKMHIDDVNLLWQNKLFINRSLCLYYRVLWSKSKKLYSKIFSLHFLVTQSRSKSVKTISRCP